MRANGAAHQDRSSAARPSFQRSIEHRLAPVTDILAYIDTIQILVKWTCLRRLAGLWLTGAGMVRRPEHIENSPLYRVRIHQPTARTFDFIANLGKSNYIISRTDVAFDFVVASRDAANGLQRFLEHHLTQPWRGKRRTHSDFTTLYFGEKITSRNVAIYSDKPSKITGGHCTHVELRYWHAASCRRIGIETAEDLLVLDPTHIVRRGFRF